MGSSLSRTVEIQIYNRTQNFTLRKPRTYFECGSCSKSPIPELPPGFSDTSHFPGSFPFWGVAGILVYEAESFTLAIYFSNPIDYNKYSMELGLELSASKVHVDSSLANIYTRMANGTYSSSGLDTQFNRVTMRTGHGTVQLSDGPVKVMATMSNAKTSQLHVVLEEELRTERSS